MFNYYLRELDRIEVREKRKSCVAWLQEDGRYAVSKINRAVSMKITIKDSKRWNILVEERG